LSQQEYEVEKIFDAGDFSIESETIDWLKGNKTVADSQSGLRAMKLYQDMKMAMDK
jgi:hypothetical protein